MATSLTEWETGTITYLNFLVLISVRSVPFTVDQMPTVSAEPTREKQSQAQQSSGSSTTTQVSQAQTPIDKATPLPLHRRSMSFLDQNVDSAKCWTLMIYACFMTGFTSSVSFTACYIWCGFQTGGVAQLGLAVARNFAPRPLRTYIFEKPDQQALCSLLCFLIGSSFGRIGDKLGPKKRKWLIIASVLQALMLMAASLAHWGSKESSHASNRCDPSWKSPLGMTALGFASASLGLQGIIGKRLNTQLATAVVLTTVWVELVNDPKLFFLGKNIVRDHKALGVLALFVGALVGRAIIDVIGAEGCLGVAAGLRILGIAGFLWVPAEGA